MLPLGSVHRWYELSERSPVDEAVTGIRRDKDEDIFRRGSCNRKGSGFGKPCTSCLEVRSYLSQRRGLVMTEYSYSEGSTPLKRVDINNSKWKLRGKPISTPTCTPRKKFLGACVTGSLDNSVKQLHDIAVCRHSIR